MNDLITTEFFELMNEYSQEVTNEQMHIAYGKLIAHINTFSQIGNDLTSIIRKLNITRIELVFILEQDQCEQEKKCPKTSLY